MVNLKKVSLLISRDEKNQCVLISEFLLGIGLLKWLI